MKKTQTLVIAALLTAFTCIATMAIKFPTPTLGYIHLGDGLVLLCGILLGPWYGALTAGIGSMFADLFLGYVSYAPATLVIKALTAMVAALIFHRIHRKVNSQKSFYIGIIVGGIFAEMIMILGYFLYETMLAAFAYGSVTTMSLAVGLAAAVVGIPFNIVQGVVGIIVSLLLFPILMKADFIREKVK